MSSNTKIQGKEDELMHCTIFHRRPLCHLEGDGEMRAEDLGWPEKYEKTAVVVAHSHEDAYAKTQHLHRPWWENPGVKAFGIAARSTSIGDIMQDNSGQLWVVARFGFGKLVGNLAALAQAINAPINLRIMDGCTKIMVWYDHPEDPALESLLIPKGVEGAVMQSIPGQRSSDFETALEIACGRLLATLVTCRAASRQRTMTKSS